MLSVNSDKPQPPCTLAFTFNTKLEQRTEKYMVKCTVLKSVNTNHISKRLCFFFFFLHFNIYIVVCISCSLQSAFRGMLGICNAISNTFKHSNTGMSTKTR